MLEGVVIRRFLGGVALVFAGLLPAAAPAQAQTLVDDRGTAVTLPRTPQRIVSLLPSLTETVCALGGCDRLVGVDNFSNWPERVRSLPRVGGLDDAQVETILALRPDLVLAAGSTRAVARLESLGLKVVTLEPRTLADWRRAALQIDRALGLGRSEALLQQVDAGLAAAAAALPPPQRGQRVYFEVSGEPYAASPTSFIGELLARMGARNVVPDDLGPFPRLNPEFVVRADPQVLMLSDTATPSLAARPGWSRISGLRERRVCTFDERQGDVLVRPGPRMAQGAQWMVACLQGRSNRSAP